MEEAAFTIRNLNNACVCGSYYIGQSGRNEPVRQKEHHLKLGEMDKSALADYGW